MKQIILTVLFSTLFSSVAFAQATATLNVKLYPIQTIMIGGENTINLEYKTKDNYSNGVTENVDNHLVVYSTGGFAVNVKSDTENLVYTKDDFSSSIDASTINLIPSLGQDNQLSNASLSAVTLSNSTTNLISSQVGGTDLKFNVAYVGKGNNDYINKYYNVESPNVYTTTVTYTIEAQ